MGGEDFRLTLETRARSHREDPTDAERALAVTLRTAGVRFEQQKVIVGKAAAIADFYIPRLNLVIEVDGAGQSKYDQFKYDAVRSYRIRKELGATVVRIPNDAALCPDTAREIVWAIAATEEHQLGELQRRVYEIVIGARSTGLERWLLDRLDLQDTYIRDEAGQKHGRPPKVAYVEKQKKKKKKKKNEKKRRKHARAELSLAEARSALQREREKLERKRARRRRARSGMMQAGSAGNELSSHSLKVEHTTCRSYK